MRIDCRLPPEPDWPWLISTYPGDVLLHVERSFQDIADRICGRLAYLATPYTREVLGADLHWDRGLSIAAEIRAARWARRFALAGATVVSPIILACAICHSDFEGDLSPLDEAFWARWCQPLLNACGAVVIPAIAGWDQSRGVWRDACWALQCNVPVYLVAEGSEFGGQKICAESAARGGGGP
ncbi:hypothetical protein DL1_03200 [Thioclava dalianensis]|uniref:DUF1937 domain-containing protein n=1 Tax=Thioclava dalianensis TaxID=1185766 RepID=A0A074TKU0_9RHOB|nr:DUF1937 family protein [Thioclava dalianensis]KEP69618.1 hypothetical protein DL1_03200 [Thioclava dalianensis]SFN15806.1 protein of unknown function [Thioclava dalianensis]